MEPLTLWEERLPRSLLQRAPLISDPDMHLEIDAPRFASIDGEPMPQPREKAARLVYRQGTRRYPTLPVMARAAADCRPETYIEGLEAEGIDLAILSPTDTMALVRYDALASADALAICRVYNDWAFEFTQAEPARFKFWGFVPPHDAELAAEEARRCVEQLGAAGVATIQGAVNGHLWSDDFFDPLWRELDRLNAPFGLHVSFLGQVADDFRRRYSGHPRTDIVANTLGLGGFFAQTAVAELILGGVLERFPNLRPVIMESCVSWLPWLLWRLDEKWETYHQDVDYHLSLKPSDYFRRQCWAVVECEEDVAKYTVDFMGDDNLLVSTDFPHHDAPFPDGIKTFLGLAGLSEVSKRKILWDNAARLFGLEGSAGTGRAQLAGRA